MVGVIVMTSLSSSRYTGMHCFVPNGGPKSKETGGRAFPWNKYLPRNPSNMAFVASEMPLKSIERLQ
jgi:hypothetical protein